MTGPVRAHRASFRRALFSASVAALVLAGCGFDLSLPERPQRGAVKGKVDTQGHIPAKDREVKLVDEQGSEARQALQEDGAFVFNDLVPGLYYLQVDLPGFAPFTRPNVKVLAGQELDLGTLAPLWLEGTPSAALVTGKVASGAGEGAEIAGAQVEFILQEAQERVALAAVAQDGSFVQSLPPGLYSIRASHPFHVTATVTDIMVEAGAKVDLSQAPIVMDVNPANLSGVVMRERDRDTPVPAEGVLVTLGNGQTTTTDVDGQFQLQGLPAGAQSVRFGLSDHHDPQPGRVVTLEAGETFVMDPVTLALDRGAFTGTVVLADQQPALNVSVRVTGTPYNARVTPDQAEPWKGTFLISDVPVGTYEVVAEQTRYPPVARPAQAILKDATTVVSPEIVLQPLLGDFAIADADPQNTTGYTRDPAVTLDLSGFTSATEYRASEDPNFSGVSFSAFSATQVPFTLTSAQGTHVVYAQYKDATGTQSPVFSASIILDSVAPQDPEVIIEEGADFTSQAQVLRLDLRADEVLTTGVDAVSGLSTLRVSESGATDSEGLLTAPGQSYVQSLAWARPSSADGVQEVYVQFVDHAGNASAVVSDTIVVDTLPPSGSLTIKRGTAATLDGFTNSTFVELDQQAAAEPNQGFVLLRLANTQVDLAAATWHPLQQAASWFLTPGADGLRTVYAELRDAAGNLQGPLSATIIYDTTPPSPVSVTTPPVSLAPAITLQLAAQDANGLSPTQAVTASESLLFTGAGVVGPQAFPGTSELAYALQGADGERTVYVRFRDVAGNDTTVGAPVRLDSQPPVLTSVVIQGTLADGTASTTHTSTANVSLLVTASGADGLHVFDGSLGACPQTGYASWQQGAVAHALGGTGTTRTVSVCVKDDAGNLVGPLEASIALDTTAPTGCELHLTGLKVDGTPAPPGRTAQAQVNHTLDLCTETPAEIAFTEAAVTCSPGATLFWQTYSPSMTVALSPGDGPKTVRGCVRDAARNTGSLAPDGLFLDTQPPNALGIQIESGASFVNAAEVANRGGYGAPVVGIAPGATEWALGETTPPTAFTTFSPQTPAPFVFAGGGLRTLYAVFRDEVGNTSGVVSDQIEFDVTPPDTAGVTLSIDSFNGSGFVSSRIVTARLGSSTGNGLGADVAAVRLAEAASPSACAAADMAGASQFPVFSQQVVPSSPGDGPKRLCAWLVDLAGNPSTLPLEAAVTLDATPPSTPLIETEAQVVSIGTTPAVFNVDLVSPVIETNFLRYEMRRGNQVWSVASTSQATTQFPFELLINPSVDIGVPSQLALRAVDQAGNVGPEASVVIVNDTKPPEPPPVSQAWVDNRNGRSIIHWQPSASPDVVRYEVLYGGAPGSYAGQNAFEGVSPIPVGMQTKLGLSGLVNGAIAYARVVAVDHAGQETQSIIEVLLEPNEVSPNLAGTRFMSPIQKITSLVEDSGLLYVAGLSGNNCFGSPNLVTLSILDLSQIVSTLQFGTIGIPTVPPIIGTHTFTDTTVDCTTFNQGLLNVAVDGMYAFVPVGTAVKVVNVLDPTSPTPIASIDLGYPVQDLVVRGKRLFGAGRPNKLFALDLASLYDQDPASVPDIGNLIGTINTALTTGSWLTLTRGWLIQTDLFTGQAYTASVFHALDDDATTIWNFEDGPYPKFGTGIVTKGTKISGNFLYHMGIGGLKIYDLTDVWTGAPLDATHQLHHHPYVVQGANGSAVLGSQLFSFHNQLFTLLGQDMSDPSSPRVISNNRVGTSLTSMESWGPYLFGGHNTSGTFYAWETARPDGMQVLSRTPGFAAPGDLDGAFFYGPGTTFDLQKEPYELVESADITCAYDQARFGDKVMVAMEFYIRTWNYEHAVDRNPATAFNKFTGVTYTLPGGAKAKALEAYGNFLVAVEERADGMYLEVFDMSRIRTLTTISPLNATDSRGAWRFTTEIGRPELSVSRGRAFVTVSSGASPDLYAVDIRPLLDDDAATVMTAAQEQGKMPIPTSGVQARVRNVVVHGTHAYVAGGTGLIVEDMSAALDDDPLTLIPSAVAMPRIPMQRGASGLAVHGSYAVMTEWERGTITSLDVSTPTSPVVISTVPIFAAQRSCPLNGVSEEMRNSIQIKGSRAYVGYGNELVVLELE